MSEVGRDPPARRGAADLMAHDAGLGEEDLVAAPRSVVGRCRGGRDLPVAPALEILRRSATTSMPIWACCEPAELGALPTVDSWRSAWIWIWFCRPGMRSSLPARLGTQKEWMTSEDSSLISTGSPTGIWISFAVVKVRAGASSSYSICHHHWCPVTFRVSCAVLRREHRLLAAVAQRRQGEHGHEGQTDRDGDRDASCGARWSDGPRADRARSAGRARRSESSSAAMVSSQTTDEHRRGRSRTGPRGCGLRPVRIEGRLPSLAAGQEQDKSEADSVRIHTGAPYCGISAEGGTMPAAIDRGSRHAVLGGVRMHVVVAARSGGLGGLAAHGAHIGGELPDLVVGHLAPERGHAVRTALADGLRRCSRWRAP